MQMSRSVSIAMTLPFSSTTGAAPQSFSHIRRAAASIESSGPQHFTLRVMMSWMFKGGFLRARPG